MKIVVVYIYPLDGREGHQAHALRFLDTYHQHPPGCDPETIVVCNGGNTDGAAKFLFGSLPNCYLLPHDDRGMDIGGFQLAAQNVPADLMVFLGGKSYLRRSGWLLRMVEAFERRGDTLYGASGNQGVGNICPHVRTTGFWMNPDLLNRYPNHQVQTHQRYDFEHGQNCLTSWIRSLGRIPYVVAWSGEYPLNICDTIPNGYHQGDQSNLLVGDRLTCPPFHGCA